MTHTQDHEYCPKCGGFVVDSPLFRQREEGDTTPKMCKDCGKVVFVNTNVFVKLEEQAE